MTAWIFLFNLLLKFSKISFKINVQIATNSTEKFSMQMIFKQQLIHNPIFAREKKFWMNFNYFIFLDFWWFWRWMCTWWLTKYFRNSSLHLKKHFRWYKIMKRRGKKITSNLSLIKYFCFVGIFQMERPVY